MPPLADALDAVPAQANHDERRQVDEAAVASLAQLYAERARLTPEGCACRWFDGAAQEWTECSWRDIEARMLRHAAALNRLGLRPGERVALQVPNGPEWLAIDWALQSLGLVTVALYNEDAPGATARVLAHCGASVAYLRDAATWRELLAVQRLPTLLKVVLVNGEPAEAGDRVVALSRWLPDVAPALSEIPEAQPEALATIVYTSGSTGASRGVMLSHANVLANVFACTRALSARGDDRLLSVLPLANMFERSAGAYLAVAVGAQTVYARGAAQLADDLVQQKPTLMIAVPRVYERLHAAVMSDLEKAPVPRRALFHLAVEAGWNAHNRCGDAPRGGAARLMPTALTRRVADSFAAALGGRLRVAVSGGAPLSPSVSRTFIALGVPLLQGYGLTEAGPVVSVNREHDNDPASAGLPLDNVETRISPEGELLVRSPAVMMGYWRDRDATREALDDAGWLHTGDKISRLEARRLYLTGRLKEVIVTSTGQKSSPSEVEQVLLADPLVDQVMVVGEARPFIAALIVASPGSLALLRNELGLAADDDSLAARERVEDAVARRCHERLRQAPLAPTLRRIALVEGPWTCAAGLLTSTLKLKRACIAKRHADDIERLYQGHYAVPKTDCSCNAGV